MCHTVAILWSCELNCMLIEIAEKEAFSGSLTTVSIILLFGVKN